MNPVTIPGIAHEALSKGQLVKRVVTWLAETLPPETDLQREKQVQLARHIAADQLRYAKV
jgi:hypothetical protein